MKPDVCPGCGGDPLESGAIYQSNVGGNEGWAYYCDSTCADHAMAREMAEFYGEYR